MIVPHSRLKKQSIASDYCCCLSLELALVIGPKGRRGLLPVAGMFMDRSAQKRQQLKSLLGMGMIWKNVFWFVACGVHCL